MRLFIVRRPGLPGSALATSSRLCKAEGTCGEDGDVAEVEALDLPALVVYLTEHLPSNMQRGQHQQSDVKLDRRGEESREVVFVIVLLVRVAA